MILDNDYDIKKKARIESVVDRCYNFILGKRNRNDPYDIVGSLYRIDLVVDDPKNYWNHNWFTISSKCSDSDVEQFKSRISKWLNTFSLESLNFVKIVD